MNRVEFIGNVTKDIELQKSNNGLSYCNFTLAIPRPFKNGNGEKESDYIRIKAWRDLAENVCKYVHKGDKVAVCGKIQGNSYQDENGEKKYSTEVVADEVEFIITKKVETDPTLKPMSEQETDSLPF